jgi:two-component system osmolarity sensor histidine kinase EnvZ
VQTQFIDFEDSAPALMHIDTDVDAASTQTKSASASFGAHSFCWRLLLLGSIVAWLQTLRALEFEPRAIQTAQQLASLVNLSRAALVHADAIAGSPCSKP